MPLITGKVCVKPAKTKYALTNEARAFQKEESSIRGLQQNPKRNSIQ